MQEEIISTEKNIIRQLALIAGINRMLESSKSIDSKLEVRQYEHLKKKYVKNLFQMLEDNYQISVPQAKKAA